MIEQAWRLVQLHEAQDEAAREAAVWDALAVHVGGTVVAWHQGAAHYRLDAISNTILQEMVMACLARGLAVEMGDDFPAVNGVFAPLPAGSLDSRAGERPARTRETPW